MSGFPPVAIVDMLAKQTLTPWLKKQNKKNMSDITSGSIVTCKIEVDHIALWDTAPQCCLLSCILHMVVEQKASVLNTARLNLQEN